MRPSFLKIFIAALIFFLSGGSGFCESLEGKQIGILIDGPYWHNTPLIDQIKNELKEVSDEDYEIFFPPALQLDGQYNIEKIKTYIDELTHNKELDAIVSIGMILRCKVVQLPFVFVCCDCCRVCGVLSVRVPGLW